MVDSRYGADSVQDKPGTSRHTRKQGHCWRLLESCQRDLGSPWRGFHWERCDHLSFSNGNKHNIFKPKKIFLRSTFFTTLCFAIISLSQPFSSVEAAEKLYWNNLQGRHLAFTGYLLESLTLLFTCEDSAIEAELPDVTQPKTQPSQVLSSIRSQDTFIVFFLKSYI